MIRIEVLEKGETVTGQVMISYRLIDNSFVSPVAHLWIPKPEFTDLRLKQELEKIVEEYKKFKAMQFEVV